MNFKVECPFKPIDLFSIQNLGFDTISVYQPHGMRITFGLELAQYTYDRRESDAAGNEHNALAFWSGQREITVRAIEISPCCGRDAAYSVSIGAQY